MKILDLDTVIQDSVLEVRGDGKAGGGLVLAMQSLAAVCIRNPTLHVQEWPFFSSARKGAAVRSFLRVSRKPIAMACEVDRPHLAVLMDSGAAKFVDFAQGVAPGGTFVINTSHTSEAAAKHYKLSGRVITIDGDGLGEKFLKSPRGNISVFAAMVQALPSLNPKEAAHTLKHMLQKRRLPKSMQDANLDLFHASFEACHIEKFDYAGPGDHVLKPFEGYGQLPCGAQSALRLSLSNKTSAYARSGSRICFEDPNQRCNGCMYCIINCPENIIQFQPDEERGVLVTGADFNNYCKSCSECIVVCPEKLFIERPFQESWESCADGE